MKVDNYKYYFRHEQNQYEIELLNGKKREIKGSTTCQILELTEGKESTLAIGLAVCHAEDNFCKKEGRKIAFKKAVVQVPSREGRGKLWESFRKTCKQ